MNKKASLNVRIVPGSKRDQVSGFMDDGSLKIKIAAKPVEGKANKHLISYLSEILGIRKSDIFIEKGQFSRLKKIEVLGMNQDELMMVIGKNLNHEP